MKTYKNKPIHRDTIYAFILATPFRQIAPSEIERKLNLEHYEICRHIKELEYQGKVSRFRINGKVIYKAV